MRTLANFLVAPSIAALLAFILSPLVSRVAVLVGAVDMPGDRKIHERPIPRLGGLAVVTSIAMVWATAALVSDWALPAGLARGVGFGVLPILVVSIVDDKRPVPAWIKFCAHLSGAVVAIGFGVTLEPEVHLLGMGLPIGALAIPLSLLWLVGVTNAFNLIDGLDGLSAGLALISSLSMAAVFGLVGQPWMSVAALVLAGALAGFLPYNIHPARMFLGDSGATAVGFTLAAFALKGGSTLSSGLAAIVPFLILGLPISDTLIAMARRTITRLEHNDGGMFVPDRNHIHHRLLALGIGHAHAVLILYGAGVAFAAIAFVSMFLDARRAALFLASALIAGFIGINRLGYDEFAFIRRGTMLRVYETPVFKKSLFVVFADLAIVAVAAYIAVGLKLDTWAAASAAGPALDVANTFAPLTALIFWKTGLYRGSWRVAGVADLARAAVATALVTIAGMVLHATLWSAPVPTALFFIYGLTSLALVTASRASYVVLQQSQQRARTHGRPVFVYGAGRRGVMAVQELFDDAEAGLRPVGFIDDDPRKRGKLVSRLPVLGSCGELEKLAAEYNVAALLVSTSSISREAVDFARAACVRSGIGLIRRQTEMETMLEMPEEELASGAAEVIAGLGLLVGEASPDAVRAPMWSGERCPRCSAAVRRSRVRNGFEQFRKMRTIKRPYRCVACNWRGWLAPLQIGVPLTESTAPTLDDLDAVLAASGQPRGRD